MKKLLTILICLLPFFGISQTTYYVAASGNDANPGTIAAPFKTITKVNSLSLAAGDKVLFNGGDTFYGSIAVSNAGTSGNPITYGSYGTGQAIITGFTTVSGWTNIGTNIWESTSSVSSLNSCYLVLVGGVNTSMGRWPNTGYNFYQSNNTSTSITSTSLTGTPNWTGANVCMKRQRWYLETDTITSQSGSTINFTDLGRYTLQANWGFFIQNDSLTLDTLNEWYFNPSTGKIRIYETSTPPTVQVPSIDKLVTNTSNNPYITFSNLTFTGANSNLIDMNFAGNIVINNCKLSYCGSTGINENGTTQTITNNTIHDCGYTSMNLQQNCINSTISGNTISRTYPIIGGGHDDGSGGSAIYSVGASTTISRNTVDSSGWGGINVYGNNSIGDSNFVNHSALLRDDCGGMATHHGYTGVQFLYNIIINTIGNSDGTNATGNLLAQGIYLDDLSTFVTLQGNTVANCNGVGLMLHRSHDITIKNCTFFSNGFSLGNFTRGQIFFQYTDTPAVKNFVINKNIFFAKDTSKEEVFHFYANPSNINHVYQFGTADSNYYDHTGNGYTFTIANGTLENNNYNLPGWQTYSSQDVHSSEAIYNKDSLLFEYNSTNHDTTITLPYKYKDVANNIYDGVITLHPYTSAVLIQNGTKTNPPPTVSTSGNQTIITTSTNVYSTPNPASGESITAFLWTDITGSGTANISTPTAQNTGITSLSVGTHTFRITVTQTDGQQAHADVTVTVTAPPTANAGADQTITLPTSSATLSGSGTVASGQTASYFWTKVSGSGTQTITGNTTLTPTVSGMTTAGDYVFQLKVTQTDSQYATSNTTVHVNPQPQSTIIKYSNPHIYINIK